MWDILGFLFEGGSIELVALGMSIFLILSLVKVSESQNAKVSLKAYIIIIIIGLMVLLMVLNKMDSQFVSEKEKIEIKKDKQHMPEIERKNRQLNIQEEKYLALLESINKKLKPSVAEEIIKNAKKREVEKGILFAIQYLEDYLRKKEHKKENENRDSQKDIELPIIEQVLNAKIIQKDKNVSTKDSSELMKNLFHQEGIQFWKKAFSNQKVLLNNITIEMIKIEAKGNKGFYDNPKWLVILC